MDQTPNLDLPLLMPQQAQKHISHNEALLVLDAVVQLRMVDRDLTTPPGAPSEGSRYLVPSGATGGWIGNAGAVACWSEGGWTFLAPDPGWIAWVEDEQRVILFNGSSWADLVGTAINPVPMVGINTTADTVNRLALRAAAALFSHDGSDHRVKVNKASVADTASLVLETNYSGRAELGIAGDDRLHVKVSTDGAVWREAMVVEPASGFVGIGATSPDCRLTLGSNATTSPAAPVGTLAHLVGSSGSPLRMTLDSFGETAYLSHRRANGTPVSPSAVLGGDLLGACGAFGYGTMGYSAATRASVRFIAEEAWTDTAQGAAVTFHTTPSGTVNSGEKARISNEGRLGIGTSAPAELLDVQGDGIATNVRLTRYGGNPALVMRAAVGSLAAPSALVSGSQILSLVGSGATGSSSFGNNVVGITAFAAESFTPTAQGTYLVFGTTATGTAARSERVRISDAGDVGIGTSSPTAKLHVSGPVRVGASLKAALPSAATTGAGAIVHVSDESGGAVLAFSDGTNWRRVTDRVVVS